MIVVLDTNSLLQIFGQHSPFAAIREALRDGRLEMAVSTSVLLEYEEVTVRHAGRGRWEDVWRFLTLIDQLQDNVHRVEATYRFRAIPDDADDDAFADCAIAAQADWIITSDQHFSALIGSGYKPQPITPEAFVARWSGAR